MILFPSFFFFFFNDTATTEIYTLSLHDALPIFVPILVGGLGRSLYGVWEMLGRLVGYMTAGDGRPTQALRLVISNLQASDDDGAKRRYVGGAIVVWLLFLPVVLAAGAGLVWFAPTITTVAPALVPVVRLTC